MIVDRIQNHAKYAHLASGIVRAIEYIGSTDFTFIENGQYELDGKKLVSIVNRYKTKLPEQAVWESHRKYIDVQFVAGGNERFGYLPLADAPPVKAPYSEEKDVIFYEPGVETFAAPMSTHRVWPPEHLPRRPKLSRLLSKSQWNNHCH
jgi:biofilm protein TabA